MADRMKRDQRTECLMDLVDAFRRERRMTKREAEAVTDLAITTITRYFAPMAARGWLRSAGTADPDGPRKTRRGIKPTVWEWVA